MNIYNTSHCMDLTAAKAISKADREAERKRICKQAHLTYRIGEVWLMLCCADGIYLKQKSGGIQNGI